MTYVYFIREIHNKKKGRYGYIKIGVARNIAKRMESLQTSNARELELILAIPFDTREAALRAEAKLHRKFRRHRVRGEWFHKSLNFKDCVEMSLDVEDDKEPDEHNESVVNMQHFRSI